MPWDPPDHDLGRGWEKPNSGRFYAGLNPNNCWIMFFWVSFRVSLSGLGRSSSFAERAHPHFGRDHLCLGIGLVALPPQLSCGSHVVVLLCPVFGSPSGFFWGEPGAVLSCPILCPYPQPPCPPGWPGSLCSCQICQLMHASPGSL